MLLPNGELGTGTMWNYNYDIESEIDLTDEEEVYYCVIVHFADGTTMMGPISTIQ